MKVTTLGTEMKYYWLNYIHITRGGATYAFHGAHAPG
jgi:hypothetical protein